MFHFIFWAVIVTAGLIQLAVGDAPPGTDPFSVDLNLTVTFLGEVRVPFKKTGGHLGIQGFTCIQQTNKCKAILKGKPNEAAAYLGDFEVKIKNNALMQVKFEGVCNMALMDEYNRPYAQGSILPSSLEYNSIRNTFFYTNKEEPNTGESSIREITSTGNLINKFDFPVPYYAPSYGEDGIQIRGIRDGQGYSGIAFSPINPKVFFVTMEGPLVQDGGLASSAAATPVRINKYILTDNGNGPPKAVAGVINMLGPIPTGFDEISIVENQSIRGPGLYLETYRNSASGEIQSALFTVKGVTNVINMTSVEGRIGVDVTPIRKHFIKTISRESLEITSMSRMESMTTGESLDDGRQVLLVVSNSADNEESHQFLAFALGDAE